MGFNSGFRGLIKGPTRCNSMQTFIHCHVAVHVSGVTHPSSGVIKTVSATSGVCHGNGTVISFHRVLIRTGVAHTVTDTVFSTPDDGCVTPETCRVTWQWINVYILLHRVGPLLTLNPTLHAHVFMQTNEPQSNIKISQCLIFSNCASAADYVVFGGVVLSPLET